MRSLALGLLMLFCIGIAHANDFMVYGVGNESCGTYVSEAHNSSAKNLHVTWASGYLTAMGVWQAVENRAMAKTDVDAIEVWLNNYCQAHPLRDFASAVGELARTLMQPERKQH